MSAGVVAHVGLGANLGDPASTLRQAFGALDALPHTRLVRTSRLYRTAPWGVTGQPDFVNAVAAIDTTLAPRALLEALLGIERVHGRDRALESRWGPRTLDLDLLLYGDRVIDEAGLRVPHPRLQERAFVLWPLLEIAPDVVVPGIGPAQAAAAAMAGERIEALG